MLKWLRYLNPMTWRKAWQARRRRLIDEATAELVAVCKQEGWRLAFKEKVYSLTHNYRRYRLEKAGSPAPVLHAFEDLWKQKHSVRFYMETTEVLTLMPRFSRLGLTASMEALEGLRLSGEVAFA